MITRWILAGAFLVLATGSFWADEVGSGSESAKLLERLKKVGREGKGNDQAQKAWKELVAGGPPMLVPILAAMDDDDLTSANWLRPAFEAIAEPALARGQLSAATMEKFIADKKHAGIARRLAYEWLVKIDRTAPDRLMPGMVFDPSAELRREAVERVINQAKIALEKKEKQQAKQDYQRALMGACDPEQVDVIAKALEELGEKVDVPRHLGFVKHWYLVTPFNHHNGAGWDVAYPPEQQVDVNGKYKGKDGKEARWIEHTTSDSRGVVDLNKVLGKLKGTIAYACTFVESPSERLVELRAGSITGLKIFVNGKEVFARDEYHHGMRVDQYAARATLKKGVNTILLKVCQNEQEENWAQEWKFQLRLCEPVGAAVPFREVSATQKEEK